MNGEMHTSPQIGAEPPRPRHMDGDATPEELQMNLDRTRADLYDTLQALEQRFSPGQILDQTLRYLSGGPKEYAHNLSVQVRDNPLPVALIGIGIAWLMAAPHMGRKADVEYTSEGLPEESYGERAKGAMHGMSERVSEKQADVRARMGRRVSEAKGRFARMSDNLRHRREAAGEHGGEMAEHLRERGMQARDSFSTLMHDQPVVVGALAMALGALLGAGLPVSRRERETMGPMSGDVIQRGEEMVHKAKDMGGAEMEHMRESMKEGVGRASEDVSPTTH
ncbi:MAG: DUF3618 domain-containing protein [Thiohalomonadaceae bacterium]